MGQSIMVPPPTFGSFPFVHPVLEKPTYGPVYSCNNNNILCETGNSAHFDLYVLMALLVLHIDDAARILMKYYTNANGI